ncbi:MAG TPA: D-aminoacylase, partial [Rhizomicrobium sp.]|nr:D-aminoacylase [Rhizomicrobium sp.]
MPAYDLVIRNGEVIDGTGAPRRKADVAVKGARIAAIGAPGTLRSDNEFDASGRIVAPGFIDVHTHDDTALIENPAMTMKASQGVTTVVCGNCGASPAPFTQYVPTELIGLIVKKREHMTPTFAAFAKLVEDARPAVNSAFLIGHSTLRMSAMGLDLKRAATSAEVATMRDLLDASLEDGAIGLSTGLFYPPAIAATTDEVAEVAVPLARHGGIYTTHMRDEADHVLDSLDETFEIGRRAGAPVVISHHKCSGRQNFGRMRETLPKIDEAKKHQDVVFDVYPYVAGSTMLRKEMLARAEKVIVTWSNSVPEASGRDLKDVAREWNVSPEDACDRLSPAGAIYFMMDEKDVQAALSHPSAMIGSDGLPFDTYPHPRLWGTFPRVLGHYVREMKLFPLEDAVRRMTSLPAKTFGLTARGLVKEGYYADICVFDAETVIDTADFATPISPAKGIALVLVNGKPAYGCASVARSGKVLLR